MAKLFDLGSPLLRQNQLLQVYEERSESRTISPMLGQTPTIIDALLVRMEGHDSVFGLVLAVIRQPPQMATVQEPLTIMRTRETPINVIAGWYSLAIAARHPEFAPGQEVAEEVICWLADPRHKLLKEQVLTPSQILALSHLTFFALACDQLTLRDGMSDDRKSFLQSLHLDCLIAIKRTGVLLEHEANLGNKAQARWVARTMLQLGVHAPLYATELFTAIAHLDTGPRAAVVWSLEESGIPIDELAVMLTDCIRNRELDPAVRMAAAQATGSLTKGTQFGEAVLIEHLQSTDLDVVMGVIDGLTLLGGHTDKIRERLCQMLLAENREWRNRAGDGLAYLKQDAVPAIPELLKAIRVEKDLEVIGSLIQALINVGPAIIPHVTDAIKARDRSLLLVFSTVIAMLNDEYRRDVLDLMLNDTDEWVQYTAVSAIRLTFDEAAWAVPRLGAILDECANDLFVQLITETIFLTGAARLAIPQLVRCLLRSNNVASVRSRTLLLRLGAPAAKELELQLQAAKDSARKKIESILAELHPIVEKSFRDFTSLNNDPLLRMFVEVVEVLREFGALGLRKIARILTEKGSLGAVEYHSLRKDVETLEKFFGIRLTTSRRTQKGKVTGSAEQLSQDARDFLDWRQSHPRPTKH